SPPIVGPWERSTSKDPFMQGGRRGNSGDSDDRYGCIRHEGVLDQGGPFRLSDEGRAGSLIGMLAASISGAVVGFFVGGNFGVAVIAFSGIAAGCFLGWKAKGISQ